MKHIITINKPALKETQATGGCGECQTSCQSACKTSCTVANQSCQNELNFYNEIDTMSGTQESPVEMSI